MVTEGGPCPTRDIDRCLPHAAARREHRTQDAVEAAPYRDGITLSVHGDVGIAAVRVSGIEGDGRLPNAGGRRSHGCLSDELLFPEEATPDRHGVALGIDCHLGFGPPLSFRGEIDGRLPDVTARGAHGSLDDG